MTTTTLQPSDSGATPFSATSTTNYNHASNAQLILGETNGGTGIGRWLLKFDGLSDGTIPSNDTIISATLSLTPVIDRSSNARTLRVFRQKRAWVASQATWNIYSTGNSWETAGGFGTNDCEQTDIGSLALTATETLNVFKDITLTPSAIQEIVNGTFTDNGFLLKFDTETDDGYEFATQTYATTGYRPKLVVVHQPSNGFFMFF